MERQLFALSLGFAALVLIVNEAHAATCAPRSDVVAHLARTFGETRRAIGLAQENAVIEVFAAEATRTWTITVTSANGTTCIVAAGDSFEALAESLPPRGVAG